MVLQFLQLQINLTGSCVINWAVAVIADKMLCCVISIQPVELDYCAWLHTEIKAPKSYKLLKY